MNLQLNVGPSGTVTMKVFRGLPRRPLRIVEMLVLGLPWFGNGREVNAWRLRNFPNFFRGFWRVSMARLFGLPHMYGQLVLRVFRSNGEIVDLGLASLRVVTTTGVNFLVDAFQNTTELENLKFHGFGSGGAAEAVGNTALTTEFTTEYAVNSTRPTGSTTEGASANIYRSVATFTPDAAAAVTEHGIFDQAATGGGTLWDRTLFSVVNLNGTGDALQSTYDCTFAAGS
jgi:hypothetical protein